MGSPKSEVGTPHVRDGLFAATPPPQPPALPHTHKPLDARSEAFWVTYCKERGLTETQAKEVIKKAQEQRLWHIIERLIADKKRAKA